MKKNIPNSSRASIKPNKNIVLIAISSDDLIDYIAYQKSNPSNSDCSLNDFISKYSKGKEIVIADLSNLVLGSEKALKLFDLKGANFIGSILCNTKFIGCDLEGAKFCGIHLNQVEFIESNLNFVDFRRADLGSCKFADSYRLPSSNQADGIKLSSTSSCVRIYADIKNEHAKQNEQQRLLNNKRLEMREAKGKTPWYIQLGVSLNLTNSGVEYRKIRNELNKMQQGMVHKDHTIHTSFQNLFAAESCIFDPVMLRLEELGDNKIRKKYVPLSRDNLLEYLEKRLHSKTLSLNEFAKEVYLKTQPKKNVKIDQTLHFIADFSSKVNMFGNNEWQRTNLTGLDFTDADLSEVNFAGSNLSQCIFKGADLTNASFESALLQEAVFNNSILVDSNFYYADLSYSLFKKCNLFRARFDWSIATKVRFDAINMNCLSAVNAKWQQITLENCAMNCGDFSLGDFSGAKFTNITAKHTVFDRCIFTKSCFLECDFRESLFNKASVTQVTWGRVVIENVGARYANFTGSKFSDWTSFKNSDFSYSIFDEVKAVRGDFSNAIMDNTKIRNGRFTNGIFKGASFKFADLNNSVFSESNCWGADLTGAKLCDVRMVKTCLNDSILVGAEIKNSNFNTAIFQDADWQNLHAKNSTFDWVNSNHIKVNDNTELTNCRLTGLKGGFYYYDKDNFMYIISSGQLESRLKSVKNAEILRKFGIFAFFLRILSNDYKLKRKEVINLHKGKLQSRLELRRHLKILSAAAADYDYQQTSKEFKLTNLLSR